MNTYEIPDEPDVRLLWGPTSDGEGWVRYVKPPESSLWFQTDGGRLKNPGLTWLELVIRGPLVDEDPDPPLEVLRDRVVEAAVNYIGSDHRGDWQMLRTTVAKYNAKKGTE